MLKITDLHFSVSKLDILNGVELEINAGETVGIIGPNGSGKTTLFNTISGFNKATKGKMFFNDKLLNKLKPHQRALLGIGRVFQNSGVFRDMTLEENILLAIESRQKLIHNLFPFTKLSQRNREKVLEYLALVKLDHKAKQKAANLSGGQMRLLEIIRIIAFGADLLLLDEPTAGVSPAMKSDIVDLIKELKSQGKTIVVIEHDINFIEDFCERILVLNNGIIELDEIPENIRTNPKLQEIYFGKKD